MLRIEPFISESMKLFNFEYFAGIKHSGLVQQDYLKLKYIDFIPVIFNNEFLEGPLTIEKDETGRFHPFTKTNQTN